MTDSAVIAPGVIATVEFVGDPGSRVFVARTAPESATARRLVICPPFGGEGSRNYRREVELGRRLATRGVETIRFHYRGSGQSEPVEGFGFQSMLDDAATVRDTLFADDATVWMGTRLGALVATQVSAGPLVMWDPVFDPNSYFREILRASVFSAFRSDDPGTAPKTDLIRHLRSAGEIDLLGYQVTERFYREVCEAPPLGAVDMNGRQVMMVDIRRRGTPRNETIRLAETWRTGSAAVRVEAVPLNEPWWYGARAGTAAQDGAEANDALLTLTADFVDDREHVES